MPTFNVTYRVTAASTEKQIDADTREHAVDQVVTSVDPADEIEVINATEVVNPAPPPPAATKTL